MPLTDTTREVLRGIIARYPRPRSALMPMLHLVQAEDGYVTPAGIEMCAEELGLSTAEVSAVATFYTMYKRRPIGDYHVGVCTNTLCAVLGGDAIFAALKEHLGVGNDETTADGAITLEHIECNAACDYAPMMTVNWEFMDNMTPESARALVDDLAAGTEVHSTRGPRICSFREVERVLAGFPDGLAGEGPSAGPATLAGLRLARQRGDHAPSMDAEVREREQAARSDADHPDGEGDEVSATTPDDGEAAAGGMPSAHDGGAKTATEDPANPAPAPGEKEV